MNPEVEAATLRRAFNGAVASYPAHVAQFLSRDGQAAFHNWWSALYSAIRDTQAGLSLLAEVEQLREKVRQLEARD